MSFTRYRGKVYAFVTFQRSRLAIRVRHSTATFIAEMQEAQCFFLLAVQVGLIFANGKPDEDFGSDSWQDILFNRSIMKGLTATAALSILLNQILLYKVRLDSVYSLLLCTAVFIMIYVDFLAPLTRGIDFNSIDDKFRLDDPSGKCGKMQSMASHCSVKDETGLRRPQFLMRMCLTVLILLWFKKLWREFGGAQRLKYYAKTASGMENLAALYLIQLGRLFMTMFILVSEVTFVVFMAMNFGTIYSVLLFPDQLLSSTPHVGPWSIGQIISVQVWAPVIAKYLYILICKLCAFF